VSFDKPIDGDKWFTEVRDEYVAEQRERLEEHYGEEAVDSVVHMVALFGDLIYIDRDGNVPLLHAGLHRMAELVNQMLPSLEAGARTTRGFDHRDLGGCMDPIPPSVQDTFVAVVGTALLNSKGGPFDSIMHIDSTIDKLAESFRAEGRELQ
jgi:ankyrin repeat protein